ELRVVVGARRHGLLEDRGVRRDAADAAFDPSAQLAAGDPAAAGVVEPGALTLFFEQLLELGHRGFLRDSSSAVARATTLSAFMPRLRSATSPGADAPKRSMP